jgi:hypothetical protein
VELKSTGVAKLIAAVSIPNIKVEKNEKESE